MGDGLMNSGRGRRDINPPVCSANDETSKRTRAKTGGRAKGEGNDGGDEKIEASGFLVYDALDRRDRCLSCLLVRSRSPLQDIGNTAAVRAKRNF